MFITSTNMSVTENIDPPKAKVQTAVVQGESTSKPADEKPLPLVISNDMPISSPPAGHVLVRVLAVALNPTDHKMPVHFPQPDSTAGCDFCGIVVSLNAENDRSQQSMKPGTRVCGNVFGYNPARPLEGAFAQYVVADISQLLRVPNDWSDLQAAALGGVGWKTAALALWDKEALALEGKPSRPVQGEMAPVIVFGGATATGTMASQLLKA